MHFSTLAVLAAAFTFAFANDAVEASTDATEDVQHDYARHITNNATGTFLDLYLGQSCQKGGTAVNGWAGSLMNNKNTHQIWVIEQGGPNNQVQIINLGSGTAVYCSYAPKSTSGKALGGPTQVNSYSKFYAKANGDGSYIFQSVAAWGGKSQCLDLSGSNKASGTPVSATRATTMQTSAGTFTALPTTSLRLGVSVLKRSIRQRVCIKVEKRRSG